MKGTQEKIAGVLISVVVLGLLGWGVWGFIHSSDHANKISVIELDKPAVEASNSSTHAKSPPVPIIEADPDAGNTWESLKLPRATSPSSGPPKLEPDRPEPPLTANEMVCPVVYGLTINRDRPDQASKEIVARSSEMQGLMQFDLSRLSEVPQKAVLRACVYYMENVQNYHTPLKLVFYRIKTEWDDSATFRYANARDRALWKNGDFFNAESPADVDLTPVGEVIVPNPCNPGFNVEVDITPVVQGWMKGKFPNHGLLMCSKFKMGWSTQGNLATRKYSSRYTPQILCTVSTPQPRVTAPTGRSLAGFLSSLATTAATQPASTQPFNP